MVQDEKNLKHYTADKGYTFRRKIDGFIMGNDMYLGLSNIDKKTEDVIENYEEIVDENYVEETDNKNKMRAPKNKK